MRLSIWRPYAVALDGNVHQIEARLRRMRHFMREKNRTGAGPINWLRFAKLADWFRQLLDVEKLQHGSALAARNNQSVALRKLLRRPHLKRPSPRPLNSLPVRLKIPLQREHAHSFH